jgi:hypothetical protein
MLEQPEPKDKLDTKVAVPIPAAQAVRAAGAAVNGPKDEITDWLAVDWQQVEDDVRRLRQRIFTASQAGDLKKVRNLQKLTAPRCALSYPRFSREEFEGRFLGPMPYLDAERRRGP